MKAEIEEKMEIGQVYPGFSHGGRQTRRVATEDAIRIFCESIGDLNPLYRSRDYGNKNSIHGGIIAPPHFLQAISAFSGASQVGQKMDYIVSSFNLGNETEWFKTIRPGDEFRVAFSYTGIEDKTREGSSLQFLLLGRKVYKNQRDETVGIAHPLSMIMVRPPAGGYSSKVARDRKPYKFSEKEVENWYQLTD